MRRLSLLALLPLLLAMPPSAMADTIVSFGAVPEGVLPGSTFALAVEVSGVSDLYAFQFDISFDPQVLQLSSVSEGSFLPSVGTTFFIPGSIDNSSGIVSFNADTLVGPGPGASGSGDLAEVTFAAITSGSSPLEFSNLTLLDSQGMDLPAASVASHVVVAAAPEPGMIWLAWGGAFCPLLLLRHRRRRAGGGAA